VVVDGHGFSNLPADQDLIADMLAIADAVEDEGTYSVSAVSVASGLPAWFVRVTASSVEMAAVTRLSGCVHLAGTLAAPTRRRTENNELWIWHTQSASDDDAALLAAAAHWSDRGTVCLSTRMTRLLTVIIARNVWRGARATVRSNARCARVDALLCVYLATPIGSVFADAGFAGQLVDWAAESSRPPCTAAGQEGDAPNRDTRTLEHTPRLHTGGQCTGLQRLRHTGRPLARCLLPGPFPATPGPNHAGTFRCT
jgi:hypothetical protein